MKLQFLNRHFVVAAFALLAVNAYAYDFEIDGIYYNVWSEKNRTVTVTKGWEYVMGGSTETIYYKGDITIPDRVIYNGVTYTVTSIGDAFSDCGALTSVDLSSTSLTSIGDKAFYGCRDLTSVKFPASLTSIGNSAFYGCNALTSVDLSSTSLTSIGNSAFCGCDALTSVDFPASLTSIGSGALSGCTSLSNLTMDEDNPAFTLCDNVLYSKELDTLVCYPTGLDTTVVIPATVRAIREDAFPGKVSSVYCQPQTPPEAVDGEFHGMFSANELMNAVLYVPVGTKTAYMQVDPWRNFWNVEETDFATVAIGGVAAQGEPTVTVRGGKIVVDGASTTGVIEVFTADGRCAYRGTSTVIESLPKGAYVVRIGKFTQKVML